MTITLSKQEALNVGEALRLAANGEDPMILKDKLTITLVCAAEECALCWQIKIGAFKRIYIERGPKHDSIQLDIDIVTR